MLMQTWIEHMLAAFFDIYENGEHEMSPEVYDRAVFIVSIGVPMILYIAVIFAFVCCVWAAFDKARGLRGR